LKKPTGSVRFRFYKPETEKTELNRTQTEKNRKQTEPKPIQTEKTKSNRVLSKKTEPKPVGLNRFHLKKKKQFNSVLFFIKTKPNKK
jgi:hypothetical protein